MRGQQKWTLGIAAGLTALVAGGLAVLYAREGATEGPGFELLKADGSFALRRYPDLLVAQTIVAGAREQALSTGFSRLAAYIFAKSRGPAIGMTTPVLSDRKAGERIAMTTPVLSDEGQGDGWRTRFVMPARYTLATLPPPPAGITIESLSGRTVAAVRFSGRADDAMLEERTMALRRWIGDHGYKELGVPEYAFYNSPFVPGPLRRNEVLIPVS